MAKDGLGDRSEQPAFEPAGPVSAHDDQVGRNLKCRLQDFTGSESLAHAHFGKRGADGRVNEPAQLGLFDLRVQRTQRWRNRVLGPQRRRERNWAHCEDGELRPVRLLERHSVLKRADRKIGLVHGAEDSVEASHDDLAVRACEDSPDLLACQPISQR